MFAYSMDSQAETMFVLRAIQSWGPKSSIFWTPLLPSRLQTTIKPSEVTELRLSFKELLPRCSDKERLSLLTDKPEEPIIQKHKTKLKTRR